MFFFSMGSLGRFFWCMDFFKFRIFLCMDFFQPQDFFFGAWKKTILGFFFSPKNGTHHITSYDAIWWGGNHHMMGRGHHMMPFSHHMMGGPIIFHHMMPYDGSLFFRFFLEIAAAISKSQRFLWLQPVSGNGKGHESQKKPCEGERPWKRAKPCKRAPWKRDTKNNEKFQKAEPAAWTWPTKMTLDFPLRRKWRISLRRPMGTPRSFWTA